MNEAKLNRTPEEWAKELGSLPYRDASKTPYVKAIEDIGTLAAQLAKARRELLDTKDALDQAQANFDRVWKLNIAEGERAEALRRERGRLRKALADLMDEVRDVSRDASAYYVRKRTWAEARAALAAQVEAPQCRNGCGPVRDEIGPWHQRGCTRWSSYIAQPEAQEKPQTPADLKPFPEGSPQQSFIDGAKFWEFHSTGGTMWQSDQHIVGEEAIRRYGEAQEKPQEVKS